MTTHPPIYQDHGEKFHADRCLPLIRAAESGKVKLAAVARGSYPGVRLPAGILPGLRSIGYWDAVGPQDWGLDLHRNEGLELTLMETGGTPFVINECVYALKPGDLTVTRPWQPHRVGNPNIGAGRLHWIILDVEVRRPNQQWKWPGWLVLTREDLKELTIMLSHNEQPVWLATPEIKRCFQQIGRLLEAQHRQDVSYSRLTVSINELYVAALEMLRERKVRLDPSLSSSLRTVELFLSDLKSNLGNLARPWTLEEMAGQCGLGATRFVDYCRQIANMTPMKYLNHQRIEAAERLMNESPSRSVKQVAAACGFETSQYFATVFRRIKGHSPTERNR
ncbi:MAG: AraC family transcriptional regulator [Candidatus Sumerlaeota bacterium]|nr:AraC family transcriptional regulator [Candidatus Sumerlaeota bacterium]